MHFMRLKYAGLVVIALFVAMVPTALATTWYVNGRSGDDSNNCTSATTACMTIGHAISLALSGDSISIATATYTENLTITSNLNLTGSGAATIIDGGGSRVVSILSTSAHVSLAKVTIRNGVAASGGGILNWGTLTISNSTISGNIAGSESSAAGGGFSTVAH